MHAPSSPKVSYAEYLAMEEASETKHEYLDGVARATGGGTPEHGRLGARCARLIAAAIEGRKCAAFSSNVLIHIEASNRSTYADLSVVCGKLERSPIDPNAIANPIVIVEVLSDGTEGYDRGEKFRHYRHLASLREYVLIAQNQPLVELWRRERDGPELGAWRPSEHGPGETVVLASIDVPLSVDALYANALGG
jgi:Uma2 family endonuclease